MPEAPALASPLSSAPPAPPDLGALFAEHAPFVWRSLRRFGVAERDAQDVCQDVFVVVHRRLADFDARAGIRTWLYGICAKVASEHRRRAHVRREEAVEDMPELSAPPSQDTEVERSQVRRRLKEVLAGLDEKKRQAFVLFELEGLSLAEVAEATGCPLQTAYSRLQAARDAVQASFREPERSAP